MHAGFQIDRHTDTLIGVFVAGGVKTCAADQLISTFAADEKVVAIPTIQHIITRQTAYLIIACGAYQRIGTIGPVNYRHFIFLV